MGTLNSKCVSRSRAGITMIEVLVTMGLIGMLLAVLLPAVSSARRTASKTACISHMRQIGEALLAYETANGALPDITFHQDILPLIGQEPLYKEMDLERAFSDEEWSRFSMINVPLFQCPSDPAPEVSVIGGNRQAVGTNYVSNYGWLERGRDQELRFADFINGDSNSPLVSETLLADSSNPRMTTVWSIPGTDEPDIQQKCETLPEDPAAYGYQMTGFRGAPWHGYGAQGVSTFYTHTLPPNRPNCEGYGINFLIYPAISIHAGGVNVLYADGHVDFVSDAVDRDLWREAGRLTRDSRF